MTKARRLCSDGRKPRFQHCRQNVKMKLVLKSYALTQTICSSEHALTSTLHQSGQERIHATVKYFDQVPAVCIVMGGSEANVKVCREVIRNSTWRKKNVTSSANHSTQLNLETWRASKRRIQAPDINRTHTIAAPASEHIHGSVQVQVQATRRTARAKKTYVHSTRSQLGRDNKKVHPKKGHGARYEQITAVRDMKRFDIKIQMHLRHKFPKIGGMRVSEITCIYTCTRLCLQNDALKDLVDLPWSRDAGNARSNTVLRQ